MQNNPDTRRYGSQQQLEGSQAGARSCLADVGGPSRQRSALLGRCATPTERHIFQAIVHGLVANEGLQAVAVKSDKILFDELI